MIDYEKAWLSLKKFLNITYIGNWDGGASEREKEMCKRIAKSFEHIMNIIEKECQLDNGKKI